MCVCVCVYVEPACMNSQRDTRTTERDLLLIQMRPFHLGYGLSLAVDDAVWQSFGVLGATRVEGRISEASFWRLMPPYIVAITRIR